MLNVKLFLTSEKILDEASDEFAEGSGGTYLLFGFLLGLGLLLRIGLGFGLYYRLWFGLAIGDFERWLVVVGRSRLWGVGCGGVTVRVTGVGRGVSTTGVTLGAWQSSVQNERRDRRLVRWGLRSLPNRAGT